jgi:hypothetical protein
MSRYNRRNVKILAIVATNLVVLCLMLVLAEAVCRVAKIPFKGTWTPSENAIARFDEELGWSYIPNLSKNLTMNHATIAVHFDKNGIRIPYPGFHFDYSQPSVLFIGCSFVMGHGLSYEDSFVGQFQRLMENRLQVVNLGVQAYGSDQAMLALKKHLNRFNTKIVVYSYIRDHIRRNGNYDRRLLMPGANFLGTKPLFRLSSDGDLYLAKRPVRYENYVNSWFIDALKIRLGSKLGWFQPYPVELTKAIIIEMKRYTEAHNAEFLLVNWDGKGGQEDDDPLNDLSTVDVVNLRQNAPPDWDKMRIPGDGHPDARAGRYVSRLLLDYFSSKGWSK